MGSNKQYGQLPSLSQLDFVGELGRSWWLISARGGGGAGYSAAFNNPTQKYDKMRRFAEISLMELLVSLERCENVVECDEKNFHVYYEGRYSSLKNKLSKKSDFGKKREKRSFGTQSFRTQNRKNSLATGV